MSESITNVPDAVRVLGALPVPVGPEPQPLKVFVALYDGAEPEVFATAEAARECCDDLVKVDVADGRGWDWVVNEDGVHVQFWTHVDDDRPLSETSGSVTPVVVQGDGPLSELERLRKELSQAEDDRTGACLARWEEEQENARLRLALASAQRGRRELRGLIESMRAELNGHECPPPGESPLEMVTRFVLRLVEAERQLAALLAERHSTNESLSLAAEQLRVDRDRIAELEAERQQWRQTAYLLAGATGLIPQSPSVDLSADKLKQLLAPRDPDACTECGDGPSAWCPGCAKCRCVAAHDMGCARRVVDA